MRLDAAYAGLPHTIHVRTHRSAVKAAKGVHEVEASLQSRHSQPSRKDKVSITHYWTCARLATLHKVTSEAEASASQCAAMGMAPRRKGTYLRLTQRRNFQEEQNGKALPELKTICISFKNMQYPDAKLGHLHAAVIKR